MWQRCFSEPGAAVAPAAADASAAAGTGEATVVPHYIYHIVQCMRTY